ncbi:MAG: hypothetical protein AB1Z98_30200, partial [Nannocystaceae bacterium]
MSDMTGSLPSDSSSNPAPRPLVRHTRREQWGRALMVWERENKRGYQFEDGEVRVFAEPFFSLLQPAAKPDPVLRYRLREKAITNGVLERDEKDAKGRSKKPLPTLDDQVTVFEQLYAEGFHGAEWTDSTRIRLESRRLKRHRDPAIEQAQVELAEPVLRDCIARGEYAEVFQRLVAVVGGTDLATRQQLDVFRSIKVDAELAESMVCFIHDIRRGDLATMARLRRALARQGVRKLPWTALTAPRALLWPSDHMCVRPSVIRAQAKLLGNQYKPDQQPSAAAYSRCLELGMLVRSHLTKVGFLPRDLFDVCAFMRVTL